ncbi:MAG: hypothetical protein KDA61_06135, partial [Planctomycetales bacterium]|nr:hypothetical protein [Planctomycetales bacterium]
MRFDRTGKVALTGGVTVANELLDFESRPDLSVGLQSTGNNAWNGVIRTEGGAASPYNHIESTSGTLTLNQLYAEDNNEQRTFVFSGAGNTTITGRLTDSAIDVDTLAVTPSAASNVGVLKRGTGTLTIGYGTANDDDYWFGPTDIQEGAMVVTAGAGDVGELRSSDIAVRAGATLNVSSFGSYSQQVGQTLRGEGTIVANTLAMFDDGSLAPGDAAGKAGVLRVSGNASLSAFATPGTEGVWSFDVGNNADASGDVLAVSGSFNASSTPALTVNVTPSHGHLDAGSRAIVTHSGGTNSGMTGTTARITDAAGNPLVTRQTVAIQAVANQVNVVVTGEEASRVWSGGVSNAWDVSTSNWQGGDSQFRDLDHITFNDSAATKNVAIDSNRAAGSITFANSVPYNISGAGAITGSGAVNVTGTGEVTLANAGNNYTGPTTINAGGSLRMTSASTGSITNAGTLSLGVPQTIEVIVQNGAAAVGSGGHKALAFEAEAFQSLTENDATGTTWVVNSSVPDSFGDALYATEAASNTAT